MPNVNIQYRNKSIYQCQRWWGRVKSSQLPNLQKVNSSWLPSPVKSTTVKFASNLIWSMPKQCGLFRWTRISRTTPKTLVNLGQWREKVYCHSVIFCGQIRKSTIVKLLRIARFWCPSMRPAKIEFSHPKLKSNDVYFTLVKALQQTCNFLRSSLFKVSRTSWFWCQKLWHAKI